MSGGVDEQSITHNLGLCSADWGARLGLGRAACVAGHKLQPAHSFSVVSEEELVWAEVLQVFGETTPAKVGSQAQPWVAVVVGYHI
ncbi:MAG: hypothetical protein ACRDDI_02185 [Aeromonas veronii]